MVRALAGDSTMTRGLGTAQQVWQVREDLSNSVARLPSSGMDPKHLLETFGTLGLFIIVFAESGLFFGFFLPGDSLLFTAGLLSSQDKLPALPILLVGCFVAAVAGDQVGYL